MKRTTLKKRIESLKIKSLVARNILHYLTGETRCANYINKDVIRPCKYNRSCGRVNVIDYRWQIEEALTLCKIKYEKGNDAPRGGATGNYIKILTKFSD